MMRTACPGPTGTVASCPAIASPATASVTGVSGVAAATSARRTAKPSTALFSKEGKACGARTDAASTRP